MVKGKGKEPIKGAITHPDGRRYTGEFKDGKMHGKGEFTYSDGRKQIGEFKDDKFVGE